MTSRSRAWQIFVGALYGLLAGCGGDGGGEPTRVTVIAKVGGDAQEGVVEQTLAQPILVLVTENNAPLAGATVDWLTTGTEGTLDPQSSVTDGDGLTSATWTLGRFVGINRVTAQVSGGDQPSVNFTAQAFPDEPAVLVKGTGDNQRAFVNRVLDDISVRVTDQFENSVPGVDVGWTASGGTLSSSHVFTDPGGVSTVQLTLGGIPGTIMLTAAVPGLSGSPQVFTVTADPLPAEATVLVGNNFFRSERNSSTNPAVDTLGVGGSVSWTWGSVGSTPHSVRSLGSPSFTSSVTKTGNGSSHTVTFSAPGIYRYDCAVHGPSMTGRVLVE
jgi:plastocyanin